MKDEDFYFDIIVKLLFRIQDVKEYFFSERIETEDIRCLIRDTVRMCNGLWSIQQSLKAQNDLETAIEHKLKKYSSIKFTIQEIRVEPDEAAFKMLQSNREKAVEIHVAINDTDAVVAKNTQNQRIIDSESELKMKKMQQMAFMMQNFGSLGPIVNEYLQGDMQGKELYDYIMNAKTSEMSMLNTALSNDLLTQNEAMDKLNEILGDVKFLQLGQNGQISSKSEEKTIEEKEEKEVAKEPSPVDGDYI